MYKGILIICAVVFSACSLNKELVSVKHHPAKGGPSFYIDIPKVYTFQGFAGSHETEHRYVYSDSSLIYITNFSGGGPNYDNIRKQGTFYKLFDIEHSENDTLLLAGTDSLGVYWK